MVKLKRSYKRDGRTLRLTVRLKLYKNGKTVKASSFLKNSAVVATAERVSWDKGYIRVEYAVDKETGELIYNDADFYTLIQLRGLLSGFTEKSLTDYLCA